MNKPFATLLLAALAASPAFAETQFGLSVGVYQPGIYGRIDLGNQPPPPVIYAQPRIVQRHRVEIHQEPTYMYVPRGHQRNWRRHCRQYGACGQPVYFVQERWIKERYDEDHGRRGGNHGHGNRGRGRD